MRVYLGQTRSRALLERLELLGFGEITQRNEFPPRRRPWVLDNGAFADWRAGRPFGEVRFRAALEQSTEIERPDFVVVPDRVAAGLDSLRLSLDWVDACAAVAPAYLVVQDGMSPRDVVPVLERFGGVFVGGSLPWKIETARSWVALAHKHHKPAHVGRVGTWRRVLWARRIEADSIDSSEPLWSAHKLRTFVRALSDPQQELVLR